MKYIQTEKKFWRVWDKDPEWMLVNKSGRVVKVDDWYTKEMLEQEIEDELKELKHLTDDFKYNYTVG